MELNVMVTQNTKAVIVPLRCYVFPDFHSFIYFFSADVGQT